MAGAIKPQQKTDELVEQLEDGLEQAKGFLLEELIKIGTASKNKTIDVNDNDVKDAIQSLIYANPNDPKNKEKGGGVLSITATVIDIKKQIAKWKEKGLSDKAFNRISKEIEELPDQFKKELSTQKGVDNLINERVKNNSILQQIHFVIEGRGVNYIEKKNIINKINHDIKISPVIVSTLLENRALLNPLIRTAY